MDSHRVRIVDCIDNSGKDHFFVELREDQFVEVAELPTHEAIETYVAKEDKQRQQFEAGKCKSYKMVIGFADRAFRIGIVKNWKEVEPITA